MAPFTHHPPAVSDTPPSVPRLRLNAIPHRGAILAGGWWPRSGDPVAELPGLILALDDRRGPVHRLEMGVTGWRNRPDLLAVAGRAVHISWSPDMPPDLLVAVGRNGSRTRLLVVPPGVGAFTAWSALDLAALTTNTARASEVMDIASLLPPPPRTSVESDGDPESAWFHEDGVPPRTSVRRGTDAFALRVEPAGPKQVLVRISGEIDVTTEPERWDPLFDVFHTDADKVVVDLSGVSSCGSAGISLLTAARARAELVGMDLRLVTRSARVRWLLEHTGPYKLPPVHTTVEEALSHAW
ncbi:DUF5994 family protein [Nocardiopsis halotolerans]|uniref:DUF5994 family protein n=1 Tax=Nocardiopsis halotolerans TaxID=124252 RepID=UPI00034B353F|nr:DUF5994 family protein [Nocardiopsis halotolerans]